jgi:hypothetical protein
LVFPAENLGYCLKIDKWMDKSQAVAVLDKTADNQDYKLVKLQMFKSEKGDIQ